MASITLFGLEVDASGALQTIRGVTQASTDLAKSGGQSAKQFGADVASSMAATEASATRAAAAIGKVGTAAATAQQEQAQAAAQQAVANAEATAAAERERAAQMALVAAQQQRAQQEAALIAQAQQLAATAHLVDLANEQSAQSYAKQAAAIRETAAAMNAANPGSNMLTRTHAALEPGFEVLAQKRAAMQRLADETDAYAMAALRAAPASKALAVAGEATAVAAVKSGGALAAMRGGLASLLGVVTGAGVGIGGLVGSLASMVIGGFVISGVLAGIGALVSWYQRLTQAQREAKEAAEEFLKTDAARTAQSAAVANVKANLPASIAAQITDVAPTAAIEKAKQSLDDLSVRLKASAGLFGGFKENMSPQLYVVNTRLRELQVALADNQLTTNQFAHGLNDLKRAFPEFAPLIAESAKLGNAAGEAADMYARLNAEFANARAESAALTSAFGTDGMAAARKALADAQSRVGALKSGGVAGLDARDAQLETVERATELWKQYAVTKEGAATANLSFAAALGQGNPKAVEAYQIAQQTIAADQRVTKGKEAIAEAERKAQQARQDAAREAKRLADQLQKETDQYHSDIEKNNAQASNSARSMDAQNDAARKMIDAVKQGQAAVEAVTISQAGDNAVAALGVGVRDDLAAAVRRQAEEHARLTIELGHTRDAQAEADRKAKQAVEEYEREMERRARALQRVVASAAEGFFTDVFNRKSPVPGLAEFVKREVIRGLSEAVARPLTVGIGKILGIDTETKQEKAARMMKEAADTNLRAAEIMAGRSTAGGIVITDSPKQLTAAQELFRKAMGVGGVALGGYGTGYGLGQMTGSGAVGALGGAAAGIKMGAAFGPGGMVVGGVAGFVGGLVGAGDAARQAAARLKALQDAFKNTFDALDAELRHDSLGQAVAQVNAAYDDLRQKYVTSNVELIGEILRGSESARQRYRDALDDIEARQARRVEQLNEEAAALSRYLTEDLRVRELRAQGRDKEASALEFRNRQARELDEYRRTHDMTTQENKDQYAYLQYVQGLEKNSDALMANTAALQTALHNAPSGYKYQRDVFQFATPRLLPPEGWTPPVNPFIPPSGRPNAPMSPLDPPTLARASGRSITIAPVFQIDGTKTTREQVKQIAVELRKVVTESLGPDADTGEGWGQLA